MFYTVYPSWLSWVLLTAGCAEMKHACTACNRCIMFDLLKFVFVCFRCPTTFWVTNPMTYMANNVAAGSDVSYVLFDLVSK